MKKLILTIYILGGIWAVGCYEEKNEMLIEASFFETEAEPYTLYDNVHDSNKLVVYYEHFDSQSADWWIGKDGELEARIQQSHYVLYNGDNSKLRWLYGGFAMEPNADFDLEVMVRLTSSGDKNEAGIGVRDVEGNMVVFLLNRKYMTATYYWDENKRELQSRMTPTTKYWIESNQGTLLTIRKHRDAYIFFADKRYIGYTTASSELIPNRIALFLRGNVRLEADFITLNYIN